MNYIVTTSIYEPSEATLKFATMQNWKLIVVGDLKTPHQSYQNLHNVIYLHPQEQQEKYPVLSEYIGWNCVQRRNIGFLEAYRLGAEIIASVDDDNIPNSGWGNNLYIGNKSNTIKHYRSACNFFDPISVTNHYCELWHRGFPIELVESSKYVFIDADQSDRNVLIQADLWDGDPDIDAICRKMYDPRDIFLTVNGYGNFVYTTNQLTPFNSQNTFFAREAIPYYMVIPYIGRMDDIWGGYIAEYLLDTRPVFHSPTVVQKRNAHDVNKDFINEVLGYTTTLKLLQGIESWRNYLPEKSLLAFDEYRREYQKLGFVYNERGAI